MASLPWGLRRPAGRPACARLTRLCAGYGQGVGSGGPMRGGPRQNDWLCPVDTCRNKNFGWREFCNRCQARTARGPAACPWWPSS